MRTINLLYPGLSSKRVGMKLAIRDEFEIEHLTVLKADSRPYKFVISDGKGTSGEAELLKLTKEGILFKLTTKEVSKKALPDDLNLVLLLPLIRLPNLEQALGSVVQFDLYKKIVLYQADYSNVTLKIIGSQKRSRLSKIVQSAFTQSKSSFLPHLDFAPSLAAALTAELESAASALIIIPDVASAKDFIGDKITTDFSKILQVVGPEGGFSTSEQAVFEKLTAIESFTIERGRMGKSILTSETAASAFTTALKLRLS